MTEDEHCVYKQSWRLVRIAAWLVRFANSWERRRLGKARAWNPWVVRRRIVP